ncbi:MAG: STAS domain-containing protein [Pseudomarimonas sp.]
MAVEIKTERRGGVLVITPTGRLDNESTADFELLTQESVAAGSRHLVLDLAGLSYMSNAGLRALGSLAKSLKTPTTSLRIAGPTPSVRQVFDAAGIAMLFDIRPSLEAALADHPAGSGDGRLGAHAARLLGISAGNEGVAAVPGVAKLAELAFGLLSGSGSAQQPRAARAMVQGTQVMRKITAPVDTAPPAPVGKPAAPSGKPAGGKRVTSSDDSKPGFWAKLFGRGK